MNQITVVIFTHNEENNILPCIKSARIITNNVIVIDSQSTDKTKKIVKKEKVSLYSFPYYAYVEPARNFGIKKAKTNWVLILDADERITAELANEIKEKLILPNKELAAYKIPRKNIFLNTWLKNGGWWPDYQIRLINKNFFISWPKEIHSSPIILGKIAYLSNPIIHLQHQSFEKMVEKTSVFEEKEAELLYQAKKEANTYIFFRKFFGELIRRLVLKFGFLDGIVGLIEGIYQAYSKTITYLLLYEKNNFNKR